MSDGASKGSGFVRLWRRFGNYWQLRRLLRRQPHRGVVVATCQNEPMARVIAGRLADGGIKAFVFQDETGTGAIPVSAAVHVIVRPEDEPVARDILA